MGAVTVARTEGRFFGWSGFWVSPDGNRFSGVNDGDWAQGTLSYDSDGNLVSLTVQAAGPLLDDKGQPFSHPDDKDAEALDFDGSRFLVGFESPRSRACLPGLHFSRRACSSCLRKPWWAFPVAPGSRRSPICRMARRS